MSENSKRQEEKREMRNRLRRAHLRIQEALEELHLLKYITSTIDRFENAQLYQGISFRGLDTQFDLLRETFEFRLTQIEIRSSELRQKLTRKKAPFEGGKQA
jgi:hypothetical protein